MIIQNKLNRFFIMFAIVSLFVGILFGICWDFVLSYGFLILKNSYNQAIIVNFAKTMFPYDKVDMYNGYVSFDFEIHCTRLVKC